VKRFVGEQRQVVTEHGVTLDELVAPLEDIAADSGAVDRV
jgi:hypothetical protein